MKKNLVLVIACMTALVFSAFTSKKSPASAQNFTSSYWHFTGTTAMEQSDPSKYVPINDPDEEDCVGSLLRCVIDAPPQSGNPNQPDLSGTVTVISTKN